MRNGRRFAIAAVSLLALVAAGGKTIQVLERLVPDQPKKQVVGYSVEGGSYRFSDTRFSVVATPLDRAGLATYYRARGLENPFVHFPEEANYVFFNVRFENFQKDETVEFSPGSSMFGNSNPLDETRMYQLFYKEAGSEAKLAAVGRTFFLKNLRLPPGEWIERLVGFQYDDPYKTKKISLVFTSILMGPEGVTVEFPFRAEFRKEKAE